VFLRKAPIMVNNPCRFDASNAVALGTWFAETVSLYSFALLLIQLSTRPNCSNLPLLHVSLALPCLAS